MKKKNLTAKYFLRLTEQDAQKIEQISNGSGKSAQAIIRDIVIEHLLKR
jgi:hypothetical protein